MNIEYLINMANQIGAFFESEAEREEAMGDIANHLKKFWDPRRRQQILAYVEENGGADLMDIVRDTIRHHSSSLCGGKQAILADDRWIGPPGGSDAG